jgi:hypothetical protein
MKYMLDDQDQLTILAITIRTLNSAGIVTINQVQFNTESPYGYF